MGIRDRSDCGRSHSEAPRVAVLLPDLRGGGVERMRIRLAHEWLAAGYHVEFVLLRESGELLPLVPEGATCVGLGVSRFRNAVRPLVRYLRRRRPDVLLAAMWPLTSTAVVAARLAGSQTRVVVSEHTSLTVAYAQRGALHRAMLSASVALTYPLADARITVSQGVADDLAALSGLPVRMFSVVYNPAGGIQSFVALPRSQPHGLDPSKRTILAVGNLKPAKNYPLLLKAFAAMAGREGFQLCILGEGGLRGALEAQVRELGLEGQVVMPGFTQDTSAYYAAASLFVMSSDYEGFGNVIVEALAHGLPVVSTDCPGGPAEILDDGRWGVLVPVRDATALAAAMLNTVNVPHDRAQSRARAREFAPEIISQRYLELMFPPRLEPGRSGAGGQ